MYTCNVGVFQSLLSEQDQTGRRHADWRSEIIWALPVRHDEAETWQVCIGGAFAEKRLLGSSATKVVATIVLQAASPC